MLITDAVLLIDAENAFNSINRKVMLHYLQFICPIIATYKINCYATPSRLFIVGGGEILSSEETTQDDPTAMGAYLLGILPLIKFLLQFINLNEMNVKEAVFANEFSITGSLNSIKDYRDELTVISPKYSYFPKPAKSYIIGKEEAQNVFANSRVNSAAEEKRHLGAVIGSTEYCDQYKKDLVKDWNNQLTTLGTIAETQKQAA